MPESRRIGDEQQSPIIHAKPSIAGYFHKHAINSDEGLVRNSGGHQGPDSPCIFSDEPRPGVPILVFALVDSGNLATSSAARLFRRALKKKRCRRGGVERNVVDNVARRQSELDKRQAADFR